MTTPSIDAVQLAFEPASLMVLNVILGLVMFGIALDLRLEDFQRVLAQPRAVLLGLAAQLALLPALTFALTQVLDPVPSVALGMILVAACPGGNVSNFMCYLAGGNASLSISITSICTVICAMTTPMNLAFWGSLDPGTAAVLRRVELDPLQLLMTIALLLILPLLLGMTLASKAPALAERMKKPFKILSILVFGGFVTGALIKNAGPFLDNIGQIFGIVLLHNASAFLLGYLVARLGGLGPRDRRAITIEVGIQNSGLGLILIFNFFDGLGGMAVIAGWWGVWHLLAGLTIAFFFSRRSSAPYVGAPAA